MFQSQSIYDLEKTGKRFSVERIKNTNTSKVLHKLLKKVLIQKQEVSRNAKRPTAEDEPVKRIWYIME